MLDALVEGYGSSDDDSEDEDKGQGQKKTVGGEAAGKKDEKPKEENAAKKPEAAAPPKKKLPSASAMMASASSWDRGQGIATKEVDKSGTKYNAVPPPTGVRAEDGVMGGRGDYIKPVLGASLDSSTVYTGDRTLKKGSGGGPLVPPQLRGGRKNVSTEDVGSWTTEKRFKAKQDKDGE